MSLLWAEDLALLVKSKQQSYTNAHDLGADPKQEMQKISVKILSEEAKKFLDAGTMRVLLYDLTVLNQRGTIICMDGCTVQ